MTPEKQQTPLQKLIKQLTILENEHTDELVSEGIHKSKLLAQSLLPEEKQMVIDAYYDGDEDCHNKNKRTGKQYFQEKYES